MFGSSIKESQLTRGCHQHANTFDCKEATVYQQ